MNIPFNKPPLIQDSSGMLLDSLNSGNVSGIGFSMDVRHLIKNLSTEKKLVNKDGKWLVEKADE